jgi:hypothetical protein
MTYHLTTLEVVLLTILIIWELYWKGLALWRAAQRHQRVWFVIILVINSAGILPILYLLLTGQLKTSKPA